MNKTELKELVKQVISEETEYQALFKLMLKKSGKDINSMSDEDKKKFFNAVDKAYKAKTEGKLKGYNNLNEGITDILSNPGFQALLYFIVPTLLKIAFVRGMKFILRKEYKEAAEIVMKKLVDNQQFINDIVNGIKKADGKVTNKLVIDLFFDSEIVVKLAKDECEARQKAAKEKGKTEKRDIIVWQDLVETLAFGFKDAWNDPSIKNAIATKLKSLIN